MAVVKNNIVTDGLSGKLGNKIVFRRRGDDTIVSTKPEVTPRALTEAEVEHREKFRMAIVYAKAATKDEVLGEMYALAAKSSKRKSAFNIAVADYIKAPQILGVNADGYSGQPGEKIIVKAYDDFMIKEVRVIVKSASDVEIENGLAEENAQGNWEFTTVQLNPGLDGCRVIAEVMDNPGNVTTSELVLEVPVTS